MTAPHPTNLLLVTFRCDRLSKHRFPHGALNLLDVRRAVSVHDQLHISAFVCSPLHHDILKPLVRDRFIYLLLFFGAKEGSLEKYSSGSCPPFMAVGTNAADSQ